MVYAWLRVVYAESFERPMNTRKTSKVLMLGWEYPPHISGGLGTACEGLTTALAPLGVQIDFVLPALYGVERAVHMRLIDPDQVSDESELDEVLYVDEGVVMGPDIERVTRVAGSSTSTITTSTSAGSSVIKTVRIPGMLSPYLTADEYETWVSALDGQETSQTSTESWPELLQRYPGLPELPPQGDKQSGHYGRDLFAEVARYAGRVGQWAARSKRPDVVHAHDWMTFPAGTRAARMFNVPFVAHVHSLEQDRSGGGANPAIVAIEGAGLKSADRIIAVSHYTAKLIHDIHGISMDRIDVVHNGVYAKRKVDIDRNEEPQPGPVVLFLGRITFQKGPDYFVEAADKVLQKLPDTKFIMAGSGDMLPRLQARVRELGIQHAFQFPGFVRGADVEHLFSIADVYVMPSVSEPFGISALEAMSYETPVILSRQSGASEVLRHALKIDFWDIHKLAAQIVAVLTYPELRSSIVEMARQEVRRVHWEAAAQKVRLVYDRVARERPAHAAQERRL